MRLQPTPLPLPLALALALALSAPAALAALPPFSWSTVPVFFHSCNFSGPFSAAAVAFVANHSFASVTVEKGQALDSGDGAFAEQRILAALRQFKAARPSIATVAYFNSVLDWPYYRLHADMLAHPQYALKNDSGLPVLIHGDGAFPQPPAGMEVFGFADAATRAWFAAACAALVATGDVDGCFMDRAGHASFPGLGNATAYNAGKDLMLADLQRTLDASHGFVVGNAYAPPPVRAEMVEFFSASADDIEALAALADSGLIVQAHSYSGCSDAKAFTSALAAFLMGAGEKSFFACADGWEVNPLWPAVQTDWLTWHDEYDRPLGAPCGARVRTGAVYSRSFGARCDTVVTFNASSNVGGIVWGSVD
jgi:hypothetical protein